MKSPGAMKLVYLAVGHLAVITGIGFSSQISIKHYSKNNTLKKHFIVNSQHRR